MLMCYLAVKLEHPLPQPPFSPQFFIKFYPFLSSPFFSSSLPLPPPTCLLKDHCLKFLQLLTPSLIPQKLHLISFPTPPPTYPSRPFPTSFQNKVPLTQISPFITLPLLLTRTRSAYPLPLYLSLSLSQVPLLDLAHIGGGV